MIYALFSALILKKKKKLKNPEKGTKGDEIDGFDSTWVTIDSSM